MSEALSYRFYGQGFSTQWAENNRFALQLSDKQIGRNFIVACYVRSARDYHAQDDHDDVVSFFYTVLPNPIR